MVPSVKSLALIGSIIVLALSLTHCGFRLRGQFELPAAMAFTYIDARRPANTPPSPLISAVTDALAVNGVVVTETPEQADARLLILGETYQRRTIAAGGSGEVREYDLDYFVNFMVTLKDGRPLINEENVRVSRSILYDETQLLGRVEGEQLAREEMVRDAANAILRRLQAVAAQ